MQKNIDQWHIDNRDKKFDLESYKNFLKRLDI